MDWPRAIDRNREDLLVIVGRLFMLAGLRTGRVVTMLPRGLYRRILGILRPAEFAVRRLIVMAACRLSVTPAREREANPTRKETAAAKPETRKAPLPAFPLFDPLRQFGAPWLEPGDDGAWTIDKDELWPGQPVNAAGLVRRIRALERVLQDMEAQAARLARWQARRDRATRRPKRWRPIRPGRPPGWQARPKNAVEEVLKECHALALYAWQPHDTS
ncbi:hypothetical protein [Oricola sp.]|uniref:hypothetical protein n=1 Tax=Oricola sp. TaxID=1979950 RepID=UPI0025CF6E0B|nr:hypothetical protein [Oricola sp.]MCI5073735.1 hypothetical protein [Oricola sp.]